jgi:peptidoglycan/xylan/chitin deacetylase (PgdA/CDA1 family)
MAARLMNFITCAALLLLIVLAASPLVAAELSKISPQTSYQELKNSLVLTFTNRTPRQWSETVTGVKTRIETPEKFIALTFDACGSAKGMQFDRVLLDYLEKEQIPATLFINGRWIEPNRQDFDRLAANPLFEIANHGLSHKPASVSGRSAYGIGGTKDAGELIDEIELNARRLTELTGKRPRFYRSGTAYYDEVAVKIANELGQQVAGFSLLGDAGATYSSEKVTAALLAAKPGDIVIMHCNHPESGTAAGVMAAIPELKKRGYRFVRLSDMQLE